MHNTLYNAGEFVKDVQITIGRRNLFEIYFLSVFRLFFFFCTSRVLMHMSSYNCSKLHIQSSLFVVLTGDFFKDLQEEFKNWEASASSQGKPKSLWEELAVSPII